MYDISAWTDHFLCALNETFGDRVWFAGLQGSYARGEATQESDIDAVVILDELSPTDLQIYGAMLDSLPCREKICGFLSGKNELLRWIPYDLFQFYHDTKPLLGTLDALLVLLDDAAVEAAIQAGVCSLYHGCVHNMLHEKSEAALKGLYKSATFVVQAIVFRQTGTYISRHRELLQVAEPQERNIVDTFLRLTRQEKVDFDQTSATLFTWAQEWIGNTVMKRES